MKNNKNEIDNELKFLQNKRKLEKENIFKENINHIHKLFSFLKYEENDNNHDNELISIDLYLNMLKKRKMNGKKINLLKIL